MLKLQGITIMERKVPKISIFLNFLRIIVKLPCSLKLKECNANDSRQKFKIANGEILIDFDLSNGRKYSVVFEDGDSKVKTRQFFGDFV